jgi:hypothetical protein
VKKIKKLVVAEKTVYTVGYLRQVSWHTLDSAINSKKGSYLNLIASAVFSAFTIEAYLNHLGEEIIPFWPIVERSLGPSDKLELIAMQLRKHINYGRRPFRSFKPIFQFRNFLAHGRTEHLTEKGVQYLSDGDIPKLPKTKWQNQITEKNIRQYFDDTKEMIEYLHNASGLEFNPLGVPEMGGWAISGISMGDEEKA